MFGKHQESTTGIAGRNVARPERFELPTNRFEAGYSIQLSYGRLVRAKGIIDCPVVTDIETKLVFDIGFVLL